MHSCVSSILLHRLVGLEAANHITTHLGCWIWKNWQTVSALLTNVKFSASQNIMLHLFGIQRSEHIKSVKTFPLECNSGSLKKNNLVFLPEWLWLIYISVQALFVSSCILEQLPFKPAFCSDWLPLVSSRAEQYKTCSLWHHTETWSWSFRKNNKKKKRPL